MHLPIAPSDTALTPRASPGTVRDTVEPRSNLLPGVAHRLGVGVRRIVAPNAGMMTGPGTNTYLLGVEEIAVLDPGPDAAGHMHAIIAASGGPIRWIVVTHTHRDHSPLAAVLAQRTGARLIGVPPPDDGRQDVSFSPDIVPRDGECLQLGAMALTAIHTPGHASNCVCYLHADERLLFTGDHVLEGVSPVILPPDGDMAAYLQSIDKLGAYDFERIAPGHGGVMDRGKRVLAGLRAHRLARESKILRSLANLGATSLDGLTAAVYDDVPLDRHDWAKLTLQAHLIKLVREGRVLEHEGGWRVRGD
jgi:glyoxylase-like metal-dependent hydrolase (beta-lactamase superfamily II)